MRRVGTRTSGTLHVAPVDPSCPSGVEYGRTRLPRLTDLPISLHVQGAFRLPRQACAKAFLTSRDEGGINFDAASFRHRPIILLRRSAMIAEHESKT